MNALKLLTVPLIAMSLSAIAQTAPPATHRVRAAYDPCSPSGRESRGGRFVDADSDHDGRLSRTEAQAMPLVAKDFDAIDTNRDGYITHAELRAARERFQADRRARCGGNGQNGASGDNKMPASDPGDEGTN